MPELSVDPSTIVARLAAGDLKDATTTEIRTLLNVEDGADVTDAMNVDSAGAVMESDYDANTILRATTDNTPVPITVADDTLVGRDSTTGDSNIQALTTTEVRTLINVADGANNYSHPNHTGDVTSTGDGATVITDESVTLAKMAHMATASLLGRNTGGTGDVEVLSKATALSLLNVEDGADVTDTTNVTSAGALMDSEVDADIKTLVLPASVTIDTNCTEIGGVISTDEADVGTDADTTEKDLKSYTVPAGILANDGDRLIVQMVAETAANGNNKTFRFYVDGNVIWNSGAVAANAQPCIMNFVLLRRSATALEVVSNGLGFYAGAVFGGRSDLTVTLSSTFIVKFSGQNGTAAANDCVGRDLQLIYQPTP